MHNTNIVAEYDYYTLDQAREIIKQESLIRKRKLERVRREKRKMLFQKFAGILMIIIGIIVTMVEGDGTSLLISLSVGMFLLFTKRKVMIF